MPQARERLELNRDARGVAIVSEGVTDPAHWSAVVGA